MVKATISKGFTLLELLVTIVLIGIMAQIIFGLLPLIDFNQARAYEEGAFEKNRSVALGILKYANETTGRLPAPYFGVVSSVNYASAPVNPTATDAASTGIRNNIQALGVPSTQIFHDGTFAKNVRVYQRVQGLTINLPIRGVTGDTVTVTYDVGVVYQTQCAQAQPCNAGVAGTSVPGASPLVNLANYNAWTTVLPDSQDYFFSTLDYQKRLLDLTMDNVSLLIRRIQNDYAYRSITSAPNDVTNFYLQPTGTGAPNLSGTTNSLTNEGCYDGWYNLSAANVNILERYGLNKSTYGTTAWGGRIEYCRDYDPINSGKNALPHSAAIRFNRNVTSGPAPAVGQNIIIAM